MIRNALLAFIILVVTVGGGVFFIHRQNQVLSDHRLHKAANAKLVHFKAFRKSLFSIGKKIDATEHDLYVQNGLASSDGNKRHVSTDSDVQKTLAKSESTAIAKMSSDTSLLDQQWSQYFDRVDSEYGPSSTDQLRKDITQDLYLQREEERSWGTAIGDVVDSTEGRLGSTSDEISRNYDAAGQFGDQLQSNDATLGRHLRVLIRRMDSDAKQAKLNLDQHPE